MIRTAQWNSRTGILSSRPLDSTRRRGCDHHFALEPVHRFDRRTVVHAFAVPLAASRLRRDHGIFLAQSFLEVIDRIASAETSFAVVGDSSPIGSREDEEPIVGYRDAVTALVHEPVMKAAQRHEVRELGL